MADFETSLAAIERFIRSLSHRMFTLVKIEQEDAAQILRMAAWECYAKHVGNEKVMEDIQKYMCSAVSFQAKQTISDEYKKMRVRNIKYPKIQNLTIDYEDDSSELIAVRDALDKLKEKLSEKEKYICIMIQNGYSKDEIATCLSITKNYIDYHVKKIGKKYQSLVA